MASTCTWVLSIKLLLISTSLVSIAMLIKVIVPLVTRLICYEIPIIWYFVMSLLRPPYLFIVTNVIIIIIAVTSRCHYEKGDETSGSEPLVSTSDEVVIVKDIVASDDVVERVKEEEVMVLSSTWTPPMRSKSLERLPEIPTKVVLGTKSSAKGGKASRPKRNDTLENTWKTIEETRPIHLNKCATSENLDCTINTTHVSVKKKPLAVKKSTTFRDRTNYNPTVNSSSSPGKVCKEPSLSQDELNNRVEAFIRKFQDEMRLQRQESLNHYMDMIKRGAR